MPEAYDWVAVFPTLPDETIRAPMWEFPPEARGALMHERRVRFPGVYEVDEIDPEYH